MVDIYRAFDRLPVDKATIDIDRATQIHDELASRALRIT